MPWKSNISNVIIMKIGLDIYLYLILQVSRLVYGHHNVIQNVVPKAIHNLINNNVKLHKFINIISNANYVITGRERLI